LLRLYKYQYPSLPRPFLLSVGYSFLPGKSSSLFPDIISPTATSLPFLIFQEGGFIRLSGPLDVSRFGRAHLGAGEANPDSFFQHFSLFGDSPLVSLFSTPVDPYSSPSTTSRKSVFSRRVNSRLFFSFKRSCPFFGESSFLNNIF